MWPVLAFAHHCRRPLNYYKCLCVCSLLENARKGSVVLYVGVHGLND